MTLDEAVRWCESHRAKVAFFRKPDGLPGVEVRLGKRFRTVRPTFLEAVEVVGRQIEHADQRWEKYGEWRGAAQREVQTHQEAADASA